METTTTITQNTAPKHAGRQAAVQGLAVVGFIALVLVGMGLAIYAARYVPKALSRVGSAAVFLSSSFNRAPEPPTLTVVPSATIPFGTASSTETVATSTPVVAVTPTPKPVPHPYQGGTEAGTPTSGTYPLPGTGTATGGTQNLYGLPDLSPTITAVGYLSGPTSDSFVAATTIPANTRVAVKFTIRNVGTNVSQPWRFNASIPTQTAFIFQSPMQQALYPGDHIDYVLGFDQALRGNSQMISVTVDPEHQVFESNENNNSASAQVVILGS